MKAPTRVIMDLLQQTTECPDPEDFLDALEGFDDGTGYDKNTLQAKITELGFRPLLGALEEY